MTGRDWRDRRSPLDDEAVADALPWPGKRSAVTGGGSPRSEWPGKRSLAQGMVQRKDVGGAGRQSPESVHAAAAAGVHGANAALPHLDTIQRSFGKHDVTGVTAAVGGEAKQASDAIGASAYAYGDRVAFASAPDLHTASHEAAHAVQQRRGIGLFSGVGQAGDTYEHHADAVADAVVAGKSAEGLLDSVGSGDASASRGVQRDTRGAGTLDPKSTAAGFTKAKQPATGTLVVSARLTAGMLPTDIAHAANVVATFAMSVLVDGTSVIFDLEVGGDHWIARLDPEAFVRQLVRGSDVAKELGDLRAYVTKLAERVKQRVSSSGLVRIDLWKDCFAVLDLVQILRDSTSGHTIVIKPAELQLMLGKAGGVQVFENKSVKASDAIPGEPRGGWFEITDDDGHLHGVLGHDPDAKPVAEATTVWGGVFYDAGVLRVAIKPTKAATTGAVAFIDFDYVLKKLESYGAKVAQWVSALKDRLAKAAGSIFDKMALGHLHLALPELPKISFEFDFRLQLPHLWKSGSGFDWSRLLPSGFKLDMGSWSIGAMSRIHFPWIVGDILGSFPVSIDELIKLLPNLGGLNFSGFDFSRFRIGLHPIGGLRIGLGIDLGALLPQLGGDFVIGFELDLEALLATASQAGTWISNKLKSLQRGASSAGAFLKNWLHLGDDGVLRIFDAKDPSGTMLGFHVKRLLDGAQVTDLVPTEMRWHGDANSTTAASIDLGEAAPKAVKADDKNIPGKELVQRPSTPIVGAPHIVDVPSAVHALALQPGAKVSVEIYRDGDRITVYAEAASAVYASKKEALRISADFAKLRQTIAKAIDKHAPNVDLNIELDDKNTSTGLRFNIRGGKVTASVEWSYEKLLDPHWDSLIPVVEGLKADGVGGAVRNSKLPKDPPLIGQRFTVPDVAGLRRSVLGLTDKRGEISGGLHYKSDPAVVGVSVTPDDQNDVGAMAWVELRFLLEQVKRLGRAGATALEALADLLMSGWRSINPDVFGLVDPLARALGKLIDLAKAAAGKLHFNIGKGGDSYIFWDLRIGLSMLGADLDLSRLIPSFNFKFPHIDLSVGLELVDRFGKFEGFSFALPNLHILDRLPHIDLSKLRVDLSFIGDLLGLSIDLGDLFGDGHRYRFGFRFSPKALFDRFKTAAKWLGDKFDKARSLVDHTHARIDDQGILRVFNDDRTERIGFDLKRLFDGVSAEDIVPVELQLSVATKSGAVSLAYGDDNISKADEKAAQQGGARDGMVLVPKPTDPTIATGAFPVPAWLRDHAHAKANAQMQASLHVGGIDTPDPRGGIDTPDPRIAVFGAIGGTDRGIRVDLHTSLLQGLADRKGSLPKGVMPHFDRVASVAHGMLVLSAGDKAKLHALVGWKLDTLLSSQSFDVLPDLAEIGTASGKVALNSEVDVSALKELATIAIGDVPELARFGAKAEVFIGKVVDNELGPSSKIAVVAPAAKGEASNKRSGLELEVSAAFIAKVRDNVLQLVAKATTAVRQALHQAEREKEARFHIRPTGDGVIVERGVAKDADYLYALFSWPHVIQMLKGHLDVSTATPTAFRVATKNLALEVTELGAAKRPASATPVKELHPLLRAPLEAFGLKGEEAIDLSLDDSRVTAPPVDGQLPDMIDAVGTVYELDGSARQLKLSVNLEALLSQVLPRKHHKKRKPGKKGMSLTATRDMDGDGNGPGKTQDPGVKVGLDVGMFKIEAGWSLKQIVDLLLHLEKVIDGDGEIQGSATQYLMPQYLVGAFRTEKFELTFERTAPHKTSYMWSMVDLDNFIHLSDALEGVIDPKTLLACNVHVDLPSKSDLLSQFVNAIPNGYVRMVTAALEVPPNSTFYQISFGLSPKVFKSLLKLLPVAGQVIQAIEMAWDVVSDPVGTAKGIAYAPEVAADFIDALPDIPGRLKKLGIKGILLGLAMNEDVTVKQVAMLGRVAKKLKQAGIDPKDPKAKEIAPEAYLVELSKRSPEQLAAMARLAEEIEKHGIPIEENFDVMPTNADPNTILSKIDQLADGYEKYAEDRRKAKTPEERKALDDEANALRAQIQKLHKAGITAVSDPRAKSTTDKSATVTDRDYDSQADMPPLSADAEKSALEVFDNGGDGTVISKDDASYLVHRYGPLTADQLADLLSSTYTTVNGPRGAASVHMPERDRDYVRKLFGHRAGLEVVLGGKANLKDEQLVASYRVKASRAAADAKKNASNNSSAGKKGANKSGNGSGPGKGNQGDVADGDHDGLALGDDNPDGSVDATAKADDGQPAEIDDEHLFTLGEATARQAVTWNSATKQLELDSAFVERVKNSATRPSSTGAVARVLNVTLAQQKEKSDEEIVHFWLTATVEIPGLGGHDETFDFYYRPSKNLISHSDGDEFIAPFRSVIQLSNDGVHAKPINNGSYKDSRMEFHIVQVDDPIVVGDQLAVPIRVRFLKFPSGGKIRTANHEWVTPGIDQIPLEIPFDKPAK